MLQTLSIKPHYFNWFNKQRFLSKQFQKC